MAILVYKVQGDFIFQKVLLFFFNEIITFNLHGCIQLIESDIKYFFYL